jgi:hypothetical protein
MPGGHKIDQTAIKYYQHLPSQQPPKFTQIVFWSENEPSGNPGMQTKNCGNTEKMRQLRSTTSSASWGIRVLHIHFGRTNLYPRIVYETSFLNYVGTYRQNFMLQLCTYISIHICM